MTTREIFLENLEKTLDKKGIKKSDISKNTTIASSTLSSWKTRNITPTIDKLVIVCKYLDISADKLLGLPGREPPGITEEEMYLIECFRKADNIGKEMIRRTCEAEGNGSTVKLSNSQANLQNNVNAQNLKAQ